MNTYLIYIAPGIGDFIVSVPLIQSIKEQDPTAVIVNISMTAVGINDA